MCSSDLKCMRLVYHHARNKNLVVRILPDVVCFEPWWVVVVRYRTGDPEIVVLEVSVDRINP